MGELAARFFEKKERFDNITITILDIIHHPVFYLKSWTFRELDSVSVLS
jgi:hypothetical protein